MDSLKIKILSFIRRIKIFQPIFGFFSNKTISQAEMDKKLVYGLAPRKIPNSRQLKYLRRFLNPKEFLILKICLIILLVNGIYLLTVLLKSHVQYLPISGGTYIEGVVGYPQAINPLYAINRDVDSDLSSLIFSRLVKYNKDGVLSNDLATDIVISDDAKQYTIKIHEDAFWHNGNKLTADDIVFTFNLIKDPEYRSPLRAPFSNVKIDKVDDYTVQFNLGEPYAPFLDLLTFGILPKDIWSGISPSAAVLSDLNLKPIGSGPYKLQTFLKSKSGDIKEYRLVINDNYYGDKHYLKGLNFVFFISRQEAISALNDRQIMGLNYLPNHSRPDLLAQNSLNFHELTQPQIVALFFNQEKNKTLANKEIRQALASALDKERLVQDIFSGVYHLIDGPVLPNSQFYNDQISKYPYDAEASRSVFSANHLNVSLTAVDTGSNVAVAEKIKYYWEQVGVQVNLQIVSGEQAANIIKDRDFEIILYGESIGGDPDVYAFWHSSQIGGKGLNLAGYNNAEVDTLLLEARSEVSLENRIAKYKKFQEILTADAPAIFLYSPTYTYVQNKELHGFDGTMVISPADRFSSLSSWYLKTKKKFTW